MSNQAERANRWRNGDVPRHRQLRYFVHLHRLLVNITNHDPHYRLRIRITGRIPRSRHCTRITDHVPRSRICVRIADLVPLVISYHCSCHGVLTSGASSYHTICTCFYHKLVFEQV